MSENYYKHHVFFCCNQREGSDASCGNHAAGELQAYAKDRVRAAGLAGKKGCVRINKAGCLGRCDEGPVMVVYPEGVWYTYSDKQDIDEIVEEHLKNGHIVERLKV